MIDLHTHSLASDGSDSPSELVRKAKAAGIKTLALTDHDTISGLAEASTEAARLGVDFIRGCEISTTSELGEVHIVGLWLPEKSRELESFLDDMLKLRMDRNRKLLAKLRELGFDISWEDLPSGCMGRLHFAETLVRKGYVESVKEAFARYLGDSSEAFVPHLTPHPIEATKILSGVGATVVLAHPLLKPWPLEDVANLAKNLKDYGLSAIEAWHSSHTDAKAKDMLKMARELGLAASGGSDYHGLKKPKIALGIGAGGKAVPDEALSSLIEWRKNRGLPLGPY
ncbi:MAG: PHP domain-containing protein [Desulfovibrio sp.]|nr:PHP domain-containing protein [Desulfovibrio sp.]